MTFETTINTIRDANRNSFANIDLTSENINYSYLQKLVLLAQAKEVSFSGTVTGGTDAATIQAGVEAALDAKKITPESFTANDTLTNLGDTLDLDLSSIARGVDYTIGLNVTGLTGTDRVSVRLLGQLVASGSFYPLSSVGDFQFEGVAGNGLDSVRDAATAVQTLRLELVEAVAGVTVDIVILAV